MSRTLINGPDGVSPGSLTRSLLNTTTAGSAVITKLILGVGLAMSSTGVDAGTGDVTLSLASYTASGTGGVARTLFARAADTICVLDYNAKGDGVTDDTTAFNNAHTAAALLGKSVFVPATSTGYKIAGTITAKAPMYGEGIGTNIITSSASSDVIQISTSGVTISKLSVSSSVTRTGGYFINTIGVNYTQIKEVWLNGWYNGIGYTGAGATMFRVVDCMMATATPNGIGITISSSTNGVDMVIKDTMILGPSSSSQCVAGVRVYNAGDLTLNHVSTVYCGQGLELAPASGQTVQAFFATDCFFDSGNSTGVNIFANGGDIQLARFEKVWSCTNVNGFTLAGTGNILQTDFINCTGSNNTSGTGFAIATTTAKNTTLLGCSFSANAVGFSTVASATHWTVQECKITASGQFSGNTQAVSIGNSNDYFRFERNDCLSNGSFGSIGTFSGTPGQTFFFCQNFGVITRASGTVTLNSTGTTTTVTHGLSSTPRSQDIRITNIGGWGTGAQFWATNITGTTFDIDTAYAPGGGVVLAWEARIWGE